MTYPTGPVQMPDPPQAHGGGPTFIPAQTLPITVTFKDCCGALTGERCDCAKVPAGWLGMPLVMIRPHLPGLAPLTDRALGGAG